MPEPAKKIGKSYYKGGAHRKSELNMPNVKASELKPKHSRRAVPVQGLRNYMKWASNNKGFGQ